MFVLVIISFPVLFMALNNSGYKNKTINHNINLYHQVQNCISSYQNNLSQENLTTCLNYFPDYKPQKEYAIELLAFKDRLYLNINEDIILNQKDVNALNLKKLMQVKLTPISEYNQEVAKCYEEKLDRFRFQGCQTLIDYISEYNNLNFMLNNSSLISDYKKYLNKIHPLLKEQQNEVYYKVLDNKQLELSQFYSYYFLKKNNLIE